MILFSKSYICAKLKKTRLDLVMTKNYVNQIQSKVEDGFKILHAVVFHRCVCSLILEISWKEKVLHETADVQGMSSR